MGIIGNIYDRVVMLSPLVEVMARHLYWKNVEKFSDFSNNKTNRIFRTEEINFDEVINFLVKCGIGKGSLIVLHSSFDNLKPCNLGRNEVIGRLLELVGEEGTLAAPVIRRYREDKRTIVEEYFDVPIPTCTYDVQNTKITSGVLAFTLMNHEGSVTSKHPLNPLTAVGKFAAPMMEHNIDGDAPSPHGLNSCWKYCADHNAFIVHLGINFGHHLTMQHVVNECNPTWDVKDFYEHRKFLIKDGDFQIEKIVSERRLFWSQFISERNNRERMVKLGVAKVTNIKGMPLSVIKAKDMIEFYLSRRSHYPYLFLSKKYFDKNIKYCQSIN